MWLTNYSFGNKLIMNIFCACFCSCTVVLFSFTMAYGTLNATEEAIRIVYARIA